MTKQAYDELFKLIEKNDIAMLTTIQGDKLVSRPMSYQEVDDNGDIWFITTRNAEKAQEILADHRVNVAFAQKGFVSISGNAELVNDDVKKKEYWNKGIEMFLNTNYDDPNVTLIKVNAESAEYWATNKKGTTIIEGIKSLLSKDNDKETNTPINESVEL
ncbi:pyridoxamine 5'-phosphate oxidase family protein [Macrococcoides caseolyticum]|uniref:pyridoxamine 5'-phosphate oxidase family protein n=1 Tax=Macrococcoides caseolyticum TaxID=69966 RepID=UPI001F1B7B34|nr:pyridoxamine 5'-phosphate oxidase family protein [Macrococcus caseolyticus]MCE4956571.1 pyridoxamine 5'-phosphate oxidase family protein [Macrococcus caseolyticus]